MDKPESPKPGARFHASGTFFVPARSHFVVWGTVVEGELRSGMSLGVSLGNLVAYSPIASVEDVEIDGEGYVAVTLAPDDAEVLEFWRAMRVGVGGEELPAINDSNG